MFYLCSISFGSAKGFDLLTFSIQVPIGDPRDGNFRLLRKSFFSLYRLGKGAWLLDLFWFRIIGEAFYD